MPGANQVWRSAMGRASYPKAGRGTRRSSVSDGSTQLSYRGTPVNPSLPNMHLSTTGPGSAAIIPTATAERRTFRPFAPRA